MSGFRTRHAPPPRQVSLRLQNLPYSFVPFVIFVSFVVRKPD